MNAGVQLSAEMKQSVLETVVTQVMLSHMLLDFLLLTYYTIMIIACDKVELYLNFVMFLFEHCAI